MYLALTASVISRDGVEYVTMARRMAVDWRAGIPPQLQFGFPLLVRGCEAVVGPLFGDDAVMRWQRSGQLVSLLFGVACIPLVCAVGRRLISRRAGLLAAWIWALLPTACRLSADALTDMPNLAMVLAALIFGMYGLWRRVPAAENAGSSDALSIGLLFAAGLFSGAAYAIREEGAEVAVAAVALAITTRGAAPRRRVAAAAAIMLGFAILGGAYIIAEGGHVFSKHADIFEDQSALLIGRHGQAAAWPCEAHASLVQAAFAPAALPKAALRLLEKLSETLNGVWLLLGAAYLFLPRTRPIRRSQRPLPIALAALHSAILLWLFTQRGYISGRHVAMLDVGFVILAAAALAYFARRVRRPAAAAVALAVISLALVPWLLRDINENRRYIHAAAEWIKTVPLAHRPPRVVSQDNRAPFYAGLIDWTRIHDTADVPACGALAEADILVMDSRYVPPPLVTLRDPPAGMRLTEAARFTDRNARNGLVIYRVAAVDGVQPSR